MPLVGVIALSTGNMQNVLSVVSRYYGAYCLPLVNV